mgnify:CR=1 FL=1
MNVRVSLSGLYVEAYEITYVSLFTGSRIGSVLDTPIRSVKHGVFTSEDPNTLLLNM